MTDHNILKYKAVDQQVRGKPFDPAIGGTLIKPGELIDIVELATLTLTDRRTYNLLLANAWENITTTKVHRIAKSDLKGTHYGNERIEDSITKLMGTVAIIPITKDGKRLKRRVQILGSNDEELEEAGYIYYRFPDELLEIITQSDVYARLRSNVMFCFKSKYALYLYEMIEKRRNLKFKQHDDFEVEELRQILNVPKGKLTRYADLNAYALKPAVKEVNAFCEVYVAIEPSKIGPKKRVERIRISWFGKTREGRIESWNEVNRHSAGRKARIEGTVDEAVV